MYLSSRSLPVTLAGFFPLTCSASDSATQRLWNLNTRILAALSRGGNVYHYDVSLPHNKQYKLVEKLRKELGGDILKVTTDGGG